MTIGTFIKESFESFFEYKTPKIVIIRSKTIGILNRLLQMVIIAYVIGYAIIYKKGYQQFEAIESSVTSKVKGVLSTQMIPDDEFVKQITPEERKYYKRVWDVSDIVVPASENEIFFVTTNLIITPNQKLGNCSEDPLHKEWHCDPNHNSCVKGRRHNTGNGIETGNCIASTGMCEIEGWCPVELDTLPLNKTALFRDTKDFTVLIKNSIQFPNFNVSRRNILDTTNSSYLKNCHYNEETDNSCPIFILNYIITQAGQTYDEIAILGGVIGIEINWDCNLDFNPKHCIPKYAFRRLDDPNAAIAKGWNFRYVNYNGDGRTLIKAVGIRFVLLVNGRAGKFNLIPLLINVGSGLGLLAITTIICDIVVLYLNKSDAREYYHDKKFQCVDAIDHRPFFDITDETRRRHNHSDSDMTPIISPLS